ncbi:class I SAM-dependent RNA methyltransferase [Pseudoblastomonas halimionae]|uniref:Class I SAM-dependent RNA methyltransferase n=1 Tax=Alteriqipengyuania halimionae TaxID=1926630 RepID=A0A6I4TZW7_9SPHN|nr:class I SAM-dependent RNA methyltransferase [Alteriqipengyuania halimionae]MXP09280.1 class I SAM-dependent RNA methyltransferase [Alteriqipengyuania halimionae]
MSETIIRLAARGDGVTANGRHVAGAVTGDEVSEDGAIEPGPHHVDPPCRHFPQCGGCQLQHADAVALEQFVRECASSAAEGQGIDVGTVQPAQLSPPKTRRRATLHAMRASGRIVIGFREEKSHRIVDLAECHVLDPALFALVQPLRDLLTAWPGKLALDIVLTLADQGIDCLLSGLKVEELAQEELLRDFAGHYSLARLAVDDGLGPENRWEPEPVTITLGGIPVTMPHGAFLQATPQGEAALVGAVVEWVAGARVVADLFSGLGTFSFPLAEGRKVLAVEASRDAHLACKAAAGVSRRDVHALHRDLYRNPLRPEEMAGCDMVVLDPPRAGARAQVEQLAASKVERIAYVSCNPVSWARDCRALVDAGWRCIELRPVGQFLWSTHIELASLFVREPEGG